MIRRILLIVLILSFGAEFSCRNSSDGQAQPPKPPEVTVSRVVERPVIDYEAFTGRIDATETVDIRSRVSGYLNSIDFTDGDEVEKGKLLFQIDPRPFEATLKNAEGQKGQWQAKRDRAKSDVARYEGLVTTGAASAQDLDKARADLGEAIAAIQSSEAAIDQAKLELEFSKITAPISGQISRARITKGNLIRPNLEVLTTIVSLDPIYAYFYVNERSMLRFRDRARSAVTANSPQVDVRAMKIPVFIGLDNEDGYPHQGVINFADNQIDASTGTIRVRGTFDNSKRMFKPGLFARVRIPMSDSYKAILVSDRAVGTDQSQKFVYVVDDKNTVQYRAVTLGRLEDDGLRVVTSGLQPGDSVIVIGLQRARPGKPVTPQRIEMPRLVAASESRPVTSAPAAAVAPKQTGKH
jgi:RND family efflux transporter MFP subunit